MKFLNPKRELLRTHSFALVKEDTPDQGFDGVIGFDFLGFTFKQFKSKYRQDKGTSGIPLGFHTLVYTSKKSILKYQEKLHEIILVKGKKLTQHSLIFALNPAIQGWSNYFGVSDANTVSILTKMDHLLYLKLRKWAKRIKGTTGKGSAYFKTLKSRKWIFASADVTLLLNINYSKPINQYIKVVNDRSPFDENQIYWNTRIIKNSFFPKRVSSLLFSQKGLCNICHSRLDEWDVMEVDHILPLREVRMFYEIYSFFIDTVTNSKQLTKVSVFLLPYSTSPMTTKNIFFKS